MRAVAAEHKALTEPPLVLLACPGLDHAHRGFETFARECFEALRGRDDLRIELAKGSGARAHAEAVVPALTRNSRPALALGRLARREPFVVEHATFALGLVPLLLRRRPDVVYFSEWHLGRVLARWRRISRQSFALVFCNGALVPGGYRDFDRVQQIAEGAIEYTAAHGEPVGRQELLPLGVAMPRTLPPLPEKERAALRRRLGLPADGRIVLSAGAINRQKRMDYLIEEIASMPEPRPFLLLAGQDEAEGAAIRALAAQRLGAGGHAIRAFAPDRMGDVYRASDAFVLASLWESFGRVLVEAQSHGLPCLAHDYPVMRWVLGDEGDIADLRRPGAVRAWIERLDAAAGSDARRARRHRAAYDRFSWDVLAGRYVAMLRRATTQRMSPQRSL